MLQDALQKVSDTLWTEHSQWLFETLQKGAYQKHVSTTPFEELEGSKIWINHDGTLTIKYRNFETIEVESLRMRVGYLFVPLVREDIRTIHFTEVGIDIRDSLGAPILGEKDGRTVTFPLSSFDARENGPKLVSLWENVMRLKRPSLPSLSSLPSKGMPHRHTTPSPWKEKGLQIPLKGPKKLDRPPSRNDALWLLNEFLDLHFPHGGDFWNDINSEYFPESTNDTNTFLQ